MRDNYHQLGDMIKISESLGKNYRIGAPWLWLSACGDEKRNREIIRQRLSPEKVIELDKPCTSCHDPVKSKKNNNTLLASCINSKQDFHIDPYGSMSFCCFIKDPNLRYDLKKGNFSECWERFIPSMADKIRMTEEYKKNCGSCERREDCRWCPVYGYLEHRRFGAKVNYLCAVAGESFKFKKNWEDSHRRYYRIADISIQVDSDLPIQDSTFHAKFKSFEINAAEKGAVMIRHHFFLPDIKGKDLGRELYRKAPWAIYKKDGSWIYLGISPRKGNNKLNKIAVFNSDHTRARIYNSDKKIFLRGGHVSLTLFPTDQILIARILADREGCYVHSCGVDLGGNGILFVGHSESGKSTMAAMLKGKAKILCDDRIIVRRAKNGFKIHGTWSHGDIPEISPDPAPLKAIMFLEKSKENSITALKDKKEISRKLLAHVIRPFITSDWWEKTISTVAKIVEEVPCYTLRFDKSGKITKDLEKIR